MKITIESPHIEISPDLQKQIHAKFTHLGKMYDRILSCDVLLKKEQNDKQENYTAEARLMVPKNLLFATEKAETFERALEKLIKDIEPIPQMSLRSAAFKASMRFSSLSITYTPIALYSFFAIRSNFC